MVIVCGVTDTATPLSETVDLADFVGSATLVAVTVTADEVGNEAGAV
jgi:hypothetical protein